MADADVFVQNWRPGVAERNSLGEADLRKVKPDLIYCSLSGYGPTGPYAHRRTYDAVVQGLTGMPAVQKKPDFPIPDLVRQLVVDKGSALFAAQAIAAALFARERGAGGEHIQVPMIDASLAFFWPDDMLRQTFIGDDVSPGATTTDAYRLWYTRDGQITYLLATQIEHEGRQVQAGSSGSQIRRNTAGSQTVHAAFIGRAQRGNLTRMRIFGRGPRGSA